MREESEPGDAGEWQEELDALARFLEQAFEARRAGQHHLLGDEASYDYLLYLEENLGEVHIRIADLIAAPDPDEEERAEVHLRLIHLRALFGAVLAEPRVPPAP